LQRFYFLKGEEIRVSGEKKRGKGEEIRVRVEKKRAVSTEKSLER
jgi:hypothetical protein